MKTLFVTLLLALSLGSAQAQGRPNRAAAQACKADAAKFCADVKPGGGRVVQCLEKHQAELAPDCAKTIDKFAECGPQVKQFCGGASAPGAVRDCIKAHAGEFSAACKAAAGAK
jgi:hypothetical protein